MPRAPRPCNHRDCLCAITSDNVVLDSGSSNPEGNIYNAASTRQYLLEEGRGQHREITTVSENDAYDADDERPVDGFAACQTSILSEYESDDDDDDAPDPEPIYEVEITRVTPISWEDPGNDADDEGVDESPAPLHNMATAPPVGDTNNGWDEANIAGGGDDSDESTIDGSDDESGDDDTIVWSDDDIWEEFDDGSWFRMSSRLRETEFHRHIRDLRRLSPHESDEEPGFFFDYEQPNFDSRMDYYESLLG